PAPRLVRGARGPGGARCDAPAGSSRAGRRRSARCGDPARGHQPRSGGYGEMSVLLRRLSATVLAVAGPIALVVAYLSAADSVPEPVPIHWNLQGDVDNTAGLHGYFVVTMVIAVVLAVAAVAAIWLTHTDIA